MVKASCQTAGGSQEILAPLLETFNSLEGSAKDVWNPGDLGGLLFQCEQCQRGTQAAQLELLRAHPFVERKLREVPFFFAAGHLLDTTKGWWSLVVSVGVWVNRKYHN